MLETRDAVMEALRANDARPYGRQRTVAAEENVEAAEQFDDPDLLVVALLDLMEAYEYDAEVRKSPVVFARVLKLWDTTPNAFSDWARHQVFWRFKWVASALRSTPDVPLEAIHRWHTEMRDRYRAAGHALQPYYAQRFRLAAHTGIDIEDAFDLWATRPRTEYSDCTACETRATARHHVSTGDDVRALEVWQPVLDGRSTCSEEPYTSQALALLPLLRQGRTDEARSHHLAGYRLARGKTSAADVIGMHLEFCALSGNEPRGLEILAENRGLFDNDGDALARLEFLTGVEVLMSALAERGYSELDVSGPAGSHWTVASLLARVSTESEALAARFDARNGTGAVGERRKARLGQRSLLPEPLALGVRTATVLAPESVPRARRPDAEPMPESFTGLVLRARELDAVRHPDATALWRRIAELFSAEDHVHPDDPEIGSALRLRAELAQERAYTAYRRNDHTQGQAELLTAADLFEQAELPGRALAARVRARTVGLGDEGAAAPDWAELDASLRRAEELLASGEGISPEDYLTVLRCRAFAAHNELDAALPDAPTEVAERFEAAAAAYLRESTERGNTHHIVTGLQYIAGTAARQGHPDEAEKHLHRALEVLETAGHPWRSSLVLGLLAQVKLSRGEPTETVSLLHRALATAAQWGDNAFPFGPTYAMLGQAAAQSGDASEAVRALSESAARFDRSGETGEAAQVRLQLADVLSGTGRGADAVAVLESILLDADAAALDERLRAQIRLDLARGLHELGELRDAAEEYLRLADTVAGWKDQDTHTMVACEATVTLAEAGHWDAARVACERALRSHIEAPRPDQVAAMLREFARLLMQAEGPAGLDEALGQLREADSVREKAEANGDSIASWYHVGALHYERARVYAEAERPEDALASAELAITAYEQGGPEGDRPRAEAVRIAALIEGNTLGRKDSARARLTAAIQRCEQAGHADAAEVLARLRERFAAAEA